MHVLKQFKFTDKRLFSDARILHLVSNLDEVALRFSRQTEITSQRVTSAGMHRLASLEYSVRYRDQGIWISAGFKDGYAFRIDCRVTARWGDHRMQRLVEVLTLFFSDPRKVNLLLL